jgi:hypothetical protein
MKSIGPFLLIGVDAEGEIRESNHSTLDGAIAVGRECSAQDEAGPPWQSWHVWGNHPESEEWTILASGFHPAL